MNLITIDQPNILNPLQQIEPIQPIQSNSFPISNNNPNLNQTKSVYKNS